MDDDSDAPSPGWSAIDDALWPLYGGREPERHYGTILRWSLGGKDPLDGLSAYKVRGEGVPHWHIVTYGMTELYDKQSDDPDTSGWGFEFSMRVAAAPDAEDPPIWAVNFLQNIARYVFQTGNVFAAGHHMNINGPIAVGRETAIRAIAFTDPPKLTKLATSPHGRWGFLHVVGITLDEHEAIQQWTGAGVLDLLRARDPLLITDVGRTSILDDPATAEAVAEGRRRDGSSGGASFVDELGWTTDGGVHVRIAALAVERVRQFMEGRLAFGRIARLIGPEQSVQFTPGEAFRWSVDGSRLDLELGPAAADALRTLPVKRGTHRWEALPGLSVEVVPSFVRDHNDDIVETIG